MNTLKNIILFIGILSCGSLSPSSSPLLEDQEHTSLLPIYYTKVRRGSIISAELLRYIDGQPMVCLWNREHELLGHFPYMGPKTLEAIKAACPQGIDINHLTLIRDYTAKGFWYSLFGKKITA